MEPEIFKILLQRFYQIKEYHCN